MLTLPYSSTYSKVRPPDLRWFFLSLSFDVEKKEEDEQAKKVVSSAPRHQTLGLGGGSENDPREPSGSIIFAMFSQSTKVGVQYFFSIFKRSGPECNSILRTRVHP